MEMNNKKNLLSYDDKDFYGTKRLLKLQEVYEKKMFDLNSVCVNPSELTMDQFDENMNVSLGRTYKILHKKYMKKKLTILLEILYDISKTLYEEARMLHGNEKMYLDENIFSFKQSTHNLSQEDKKKMLEIIIKIETIISYFDVKFNITEASMMLYLTDKFGDNARSEINDTNFYEEYYDENFDEAYDEETDTTLKIRLDEQELENEYIGIIYAMFKIRNLLKKSDFKNQDVEQIKVIMNKANKKIATINDVDFYESLTWEQAKEKKLCGNLPVIPQLPTTASAISATSTTVTINELSVTNNNYNKEKSFAPIMSRSCFGDFSNTTTGQNWKNCLEQNNNEQSTIGQSLIIQQQNEQSNNVSWQNNHQQRNNWNRDDRQQRNNWNHDDRQQRNNWNRNDQQQRNNWNRNDQQQQCNKFDSTATGTYNGQQRNNNNQTNSRFDVLNREPLQRQELPQDEESASRWGCFRTEKKSDELINGFTQSDHEWFSRKIIRENGLYREKYYDTVLKLSLEGKNQEEIIDIITQIQEKEICANPRIATIKNKLIRYHHDSDARFMSRVKQIEFLVRKDLCNGEIIQILNEQGKLKDHELMVLEAKSTEMSFDRCFGDCDTTGSGNRQKKDIAYFGLSEKKLDEFLRLREKYGCAKL